MGLTNGLALPGQTEPAVTIAAPMNDAQTLAIIAAHIGGEPAEAVDKAAQILVRAVLKVPQLKAMLREANENAVAR